MRVAQAACLEDINVTPGGFHPERIIVLGAGGFIGRYICANADGIPSRVVGLTSKECDLLSLDATLTATEKVTPRDAIIVTSAVTRLVDNTRVALEKNIRMAENLACALAVRPAGHVTFLSTVDVYGIDIGSARIAESLLLNPNDYYAISKATAEFLLRRVCRAEGVPLAVLRLTGVYGPGDGGRSTVGALILSALREKRIWIEGAGENLRDYVYVGDVARVAKAALVDKVDAILNVATGTSLSILQLADLVSSSSPHPVEITFRPRPEGSVRRVEDMVFDCARLWETLPGLAMTTLEEGVERYIDELAQATGRV